MCDCLHAKGLERERGERAESGLFLPELSLFLLPLRFSASAGDKACRPKSPGTQDAPVGVLAPRLGVLAQRLGPAGPRSGEALLGGGRQRLWRALAGEGEGMGGMCQPAWCCGG